MESDIMRTKLCWHKVRSQTLLIPKSLYLFPGLLLVSWELFLLQWSASRLWTFKFFGFSFKQNYIKLRNYISSFVLGKVSYWGDTSFKKSPMGGTSLLAQWLRICLPMQGTRVRALVWEDPTRRGATKPVSHNYWAHVPQLLKPVCLELQQEKPLQREALAPWWRVAPAHCN